MQSKGFFFILAFHFLSTELSMERFFGHYYLFARTIVFGVALYFINIEMHNLQPPKIIISID